MGGRRGLVEAGKARVPALFRQGDAATLRYIEFFAVNVRNRHTRTAYLGAAERFARWCELAEVRLFEVEPIVVAAYVEAMQASHAPATVKQHLAGIRMLFDWLVTGRVMDSNPAAAVRGPKHVVKVGKAPVLSAVEARGLLDSVDVETLLGKRDRAIIGVMMFGFARVGAVVGLRQRDYYTQGKRSWLKLHEKGGRFNQVPAHHLVQQYVDEYLEAGGGTEPVDPLFRCAARSRKDRLTERPMRAQTAWDMVKRRAAECGLPREISPHSFRATGITEYMKNGGDIETAARIAGHESTRTTQLYNRVKDEVSLDEIERILI